MDGIPLWEMSSLTNKVYVRPGDENLKLGLAANIFNRQFSGRSISSKFPYFPFTLILTLAFNLISQLYVSQNPVDKFFSIQN